MSLNYWNSLNYPVQKISLNIPSFYFDRHDLAKELQEKLNYYKILPTQIEIELLENSTFSNSYRISEQLRILKKNGVQLAIDDFGTGYSALNYLQNFPVDTIKIDRSFINEIKENNTNLPILSAIISIAQSLKLNLVAEGVENIFQSNYLEKQGCFLMQGFFYSKPLSSDQFIQLLIANGNYEIA